MNRRTGRLGNQPVYYGLPGSPDLMGVLAGTGRMLGVEAKTEDGRLSENQKMFKDWMGKAGAIYIVARSYDECDAGLKSFGI